MLAHERTVNIGIETAANALRKFLNSGDSPVDCTAILSTINSELQSMALPQAVQNIVQSFLESDLLSSACEVWNHEKISQSLELEILGLLNIVTRSIFEGCGDLTSGLQFRDSHTNKIVCLFYHKLYRAALETENPRLAYENNIVISQKLVASLATNPNFVMAFFDHHGEFLPYTFLVQHIPIFFEQVARCLTACKNDRYLQAYIKEHLSILVQKVTWGEIASLWDAENSWKLLFFCEVLQGNPISELVLLVFELFLHSIDSWKVLFEVNLYFLNMVAHNALIDGIIAESTDTRMVLVMKNAEKDPLPEQENLIIWDFICKVLECNSFDLILGLFYDFSARADKQKLQRVVKTFRANTFKLMASEVWFVETFTNCFPDFCKMTTATQHCNAEWSGKKSLSRFYLHGITDFLANSLITNRFIYSATIHMLSFDCSEVNPLPSRIIDTIGELLGSVDEERFRETKLDVTDQSSLRISMRRHIQGSSEDNKNSIKTLSEAEKISFRNEGTRQNFFLLEAIVATVYAAIRAKFIANGRNTDRLGLSAGSGGQSEVSLGDADGISNINVREGVI